jgi:hypothetical protein
LVLFASAAQKGYWQQHVTYKMDIDFDVAKHQYKGKQELVYTNNSSDTLHKVYFHLYFNAFQPNSMMDVRSRTIEDPDDRVRDRISKLKPDEIGYNRVNSLKQDGKDVKFEEHGTILIVTLDKPLLPGRKTKLNMNWDAQVPLQIRRSGRHNAEGIDYSMTQWYPKLVEYDLDGWNLTPYIGREFHGVWGDFDVKITIDSSYVLGGTGYLQNPQQIGHGYQDKSKPVKRAPGNRLTWHFVAPQVHDFAWAADPDYVHDQVKVNDKLTLHFFYQKDTLEDNWKRLQPMTAEAFKFMNERFGEYPYKQYTILQGGDGGMEYPMATLITARGSFGALISVTVHEALHSWYQGLLATNEAKYEWMDEGFTNYAQSIVLNHLFNRKPLNPHASSYSSYFSVVKAGTQEPLTTHADHYKRNRVYGVNAYSKGAIFLHQLSYIVGEDKLAEGLKRYYYEWRYKHPTPTDFKRVMEKVSGIELDWYFEHWVGTVNTIDYAIEDVQPAGNKTKITLKRVGDMPMPIDLYVVDKKGNVTLYYIPMEIMYAKKGSDMFKGTRIDKTPWPWVFPEYEFLIDLPIDQVESIEIDASERMADIDRTNNEYPFSKERIKFEGK